MHGYLWPLCRCTPHATLLPAFPLYSHPRECSLPYASLSIDAFFGTIQHETTNSYDIEDATRLEPVMRPHEVSRFTGNQTVKSVPPVSTFTEIEPSWSATILFAMMRPMPVP